MMALSRLQAALYTCLHGDGVLTGMVTGIYDNVPENARYPLVVIGDGFQQSLAADAAIGDDCQLTIYSYSKKSGRKETLMILDRIYGLLHYNTLTLSSGQTFQMHIDRVQTQAQPDADMVLGELRVRALVSAG
jgi:hypothetical protein